LLNAIRTTAQQELKDVIESNSKLKESIFTGKYWFDDPYYINYVYINGNISDDLLPKSYIITTGSGRSKGNYTIEIKP